MRFWWILFLCLLNGAVSAQKRYTYHQEFQVEDSEGKLLAMPFAGGINSAQIQQMDVNGDGKEELVVWDINARRISVFQEGENRYRHLPEMSYFFPEDISGFMVLTDFDGDGKKDLFTGSPFGIKVYQNSSTEKDAFPRWKVAQDFLRLDNGSNVTANSLDIPLIMDMDGDGDLDIVTFNFASGDYLEFYRNTSMERKGEKDIDGFASAQIRWGGFEFCGCGNFSFGFTCSGFPINENTPEIQHLKLLHAGGHSLLYHDFDGDGIKDLLLGQDECHTLYYLPNKGTKVNPVFDEYLLEVPGIGLLPEFPVFHAAYLVKDRLIISSHSSDPSSHSQADFSKTIFKYPLSDNLPPITQAFLQEEMIDLGENSRPFFLGNKVSGELIVTSNRVRNARTIGIANKYLIENGSLNLVDEDYLDLSRLGLLELTFQSFRAANTTTYQIITGDIMREHIPEKKILWTSRTDGKHLNEIRLPGFSLRGLDQMTFFQNSGKDYLLLARQTGELVLFQANFGDSLELELLERDFLDFSDSPINRGLSVHVIPGENPGLISIDQRGKLLYVSDFMGNHQITPIQIKVNGDNYMDSRFGRNTWVSHVPDPFGKGYDLFLGNRAGGLVYLKETDVMDDPGKLTLEVKVYPNPADERVNLIASGDVSVKLINPAGQPIRENIFLGANTETVLSLFGLPPGLYILQFSSETQGIYHQKLIIK